MVESRMTGMETKPLPVEEILLITTYSVWRISLFLYSRTKFDEKGLI